MPNVLQLVDADASSRPGPACDGWGGGVSGAGDDHACVGGGDDAGGGGTRRGGQQVDRLRSGENEDKAVADIYNICMLVVT